MIRQHENVSQESIITEFPALTTDEAEELASRIENPAAAANVLDILRNCSKETLTTAIAIVLEQMESHDAGILYSLEPEERPNFGDSVWDPDDAHHAQRKQEHHRDSHPPVPGPSPEQPRSKKYCADRRHLEQETPASTRRTAAANIAGDSSETTWLTSTCADTASRAGKNW